MASKTVTEPPPATTEPPRERLLQTAARLFYEEGIQSVGVDRLVAEARITKATFYRHFPTKDDLVCAYVTRRDQQIRTTADALTQRIHSPRDVLTTLVVELGNEVCAPGFRGCVFINAAAEYPDPDHPVRHAITEHRHWFRACLIQLLEATGHPDPGAAADTLVLLRDGAMTSGYLDNPANAQAAMRHALDTLFNTPHVAHDSHQDAAEPGLEDRGARGGEL